MRIMLSVVVLLALTGCSMSDLAGHVVGGVNVDPINGNVGIGVTIKDARQSCKAQNDAARKALKASYAQARREMDAVEKRELDKLAAERKLCDVVQLPPVVYIPSPQPEQPPVFQPALPAPGEIPEEGTFKAIKPVCPKP